MFSELKPRPADPILGLSVKFKADHNPNKIDLGAGIYKDEAGHTPVLACVKAAERLRTEHETSKAYISSAGSPLFNEKIAALNLGDHRVIRENRIRTVSTPGGTGALRIAGEFINTCTPGATIWVSNPTWANHQGVFAAAGLNIKTYPYYDYDNKCLDFTGMMETLKQVSAGDAIQVHAAGVVAAGVDQHCVIRRDLLQSRQHALEVQALILVVVVGVTLYRQTSGCKHALVVGPGRVADPDGTAGLTGLYELTRNTQGASATRGGNGANPILANDPMVPEIQCGNFFIEQGGASGVDIGFGRLVINTKLFGYFYAGQHRGVALLVLVNTCAQINFVRVTVRFEFNG